MKKIVATLTCLLLAIIMCVGLVACETGEIKVNPDKEHYVVGICQLTQHAALDEATRGFKEALQTALAEKGHKSVAGCCGGNRHDSRVGYFHYRLRNGIGN